MSASLALQPTIFVGLQLLNAIDISVEAPLNLPTINTTISSVSTQNVDENCNPVDAAIGKTDTNNPTFLSAFPNLTHVVPQVNLGLGLNMGLKLDVHELEDFPFSAEKQLYETALPLPTACLAFDQQGGSGGSYVAAATAVAQVKQSESSSSAAAATASAATAAATNTTKKSNAERGMEIGSWHIGSLLILLLLDLAALF